MRSLPPRLRLALAALAFWTTVGVVFALPRLGAPGAAGRWRTALLASLVEWWSWGLIAPVVPWFDRRLPLATSCVCVPWQNSV